MNPLRKKRLLLLASTPNAWHKRFYSQYIPLITEGLVVWQLGSASLTDQGIQELKKLIGDGGIGRHTGL